MKLVLLKRVALAILLNGSPAMADFSFLSHYLPLKDQKPWLVTGTCRVFFAPEDNFGAVHLIQDYYPADDAGPQNLLGGKSGVMLNLPQDPSQPVRKGNELLAQRGEAVKNADGSTTLHLDLYREHFDTGGYIVRQRATIDLSPDGRLKGFEAETSTAARRFIFFGPFGGFKTEQVFRCKKT